MRVVEEPFLTRDLILAILRPAEVTTDHPFRTLRENGAASKGLVVHVRAAGGRMAGQITIYSALNADAARAYRMREPEIAKRLASRAAGIERSRAARLITDAIAALSERLPVDPFSEKSPQALRSYCRARRHTSFDGLDRGAMMRAWLVQSQAWLGEDGGQREELIDAVEHLTRVAEKARAEILTEHRCTASTFFGVVARLDQTVAEIEGDSGEGLLVQRQDLERRGLASLGQPVALLHEALPSGASITLAMAAALLVAPDLPDHPSPYGDSLDRDGIRVTTMPQRDISWFERELARDPTLLPASPLKVG